MFIRDQSTGALINTDEQHYRTITSARKKRKESEDLVRRMDDMEAEVSEIKSILQRLADK
jgi:hypothetical protein